MPILIFIILLYFGNLEQKFSYKHGHKKKVSFRNKILISKASHANSRNAKALIHTSREDEEQKEGPGAKDTLINVARDQDLDIIQHNKFYSESLTGNNSFSGTFVMLNYEKYSKFLMSTRGLDFDHPCNMKQGYILQIYGQHNLMEDSQKNVLLGRPTFAVLNKKVLSLFENEHVTGLRKLVYLKEIKSTYVPQNWNDLNCLVIVQRGKLESDIVFKTEHLALTTMGFDVNDPKYTVLCAEDAPVRDSWIKALNTYQNCKIKVTEDEDTKNVNFEVTKIRKKQVSDELSAQQELEEQEREKRKLSEEKFKQEWKLKIDKFRRDYYQKKMEERKKRYEILAERKKEEQLTKKFREDENCLESKIESEAGIEESKAEGDIEDESALKKKKLIDRLESNITKVMDQDRILASLEEEDLNEQEKEIQNKIQQLMVQETIGFEKIDSPDQCYDEEMANGDRALNINKICGRITGPLMNSAKIKTLVDCIDEKKFCRVCCEANIGYIMIRERLLCVRKCSGIMDMTVNRNIEVLQKGAVKNYNAIIANATKLDQEDDGKSIETSGYKSGELVKRKDGDIDDYEGDVKDGSQEIVWTKLIGKTYRNTIPLHDEPLLQDSANLISGSKINLKIKKTIIKGHSASFISFQSRVYVVEEFDRVTKGLGTKIIHNLSPLTPDDVKFLVDNESKILQDAKETKFESEENSGNGYSSVTTQTIIHRSSGDLPDMKDLKPKKFGVRKTNSDTYDEDLTSTRAIQTKRFSRSTSFKTSFLQVSSNTSPNPKTQRLMKKQDNNDKMSTFNLKSMINSLPMTMGAATVSKSSSESTTHRKKLSMIFQNYKSKIKSKSKSGIDLSGYE